MYRRWAYMVVAILASAFLLTKPVFSFQDDKGIIYVRSFSMDQKMFYVTQTELKTGVEEVTATMSVAGLYYCNKVMLWSCILCLLCFFNNRWRMILCLFSIALAGLYYVLIIYYATRISDLHFATLSPTLMAVLPAIVMQCMILIRANVARAVLMENENEEKEEIEKAPE